MKLTDPETKPATWEQGCADALDALLTAQRDFMGALGYDRLPTVDAVAERMASLNVPLGQLDTKLSGWPDEPRNVVRLGGILDLAIHALRWRELDGAAALDQAAVVAALAEKQANYGPGNILAFGIPGLAVRVSDKVNRAVNMHSKGRTSADESLHDSLFDLIGYAVIGIMLMEGTFELPLKRDLGGGSGLALGVPGSPDGPPEGYEDAVAASEPPGFAEADYYAAVEADPLPSDEPVPTKAERDEAAVGRQVDEAMKPALRALWLDMVRAAAPFLSDERAGQIADEAIATGTDIERAIMMLIGDQLLLLEKADG